MAKRSPQPDDATPAKAIRPELAGLQVFTTGEAAEVSRLSQQTIIRSFDAGRLQGYRVPGSRFRRIPRESLVAFLRENNLPMDTLDAERPPPAAGRRRRPRGARLPRRGAA